jgi:hypothetical protein
MAGTSSPSAVPVPRLALPAATGPYSVGATELHLVDTARLNHRLEAVATVANAGHTSFTDNFVLTDQLGISLPGSISVVRSMELTRAYVGAFFDLHLKGCPLLDGPTTADPEVKFWP